MLGAPTDTSPDGLFDAFTAWVAETGIEPYPAQEDAAMALFAGDHVVMATPTGSGKSLVATACHFGALSRGERSVYTAPIKALVSEKFFQMRSVFGPDAVGMITGDAQINSDAPIICATAEILAFDGLAGGVVSAVTMDEFHYYSDRDRGWAWETPLITSDAQFLLMSATLGETGWIEQQLDGIGSRDVSVVGGGDRPVPLEFGYRETTLLESIAALLAEDRAPVYLVHFTQRSAAEQAQALTSLDAVSSDEKARIAELIKGHRFDTPFGKDLKRFLSHGVAVHHAGLLPRYRLLVERLAGEGLLKLICGTDTLGVGVNVPIRTVLFTQLCKFDGRRTRLLSVRDFQQIAGRAGRKGFDDRGTVWAQAPEHVVENLIAERKAANSGRRKKVVKRQAPTRGYAHWDRASFERLVDGTPETLVSRFRIPQSALLHLVRRPGDAEAEIARLIAASRLDEQGREQLAATTAEVIASMESSGILRRLDEPDDDGRMLVVGDGLPQDVALDSALSSFMIDVVSSFDPSSDTFVTDVISTVEATLEDPGPVIVAQRDAARTELYQRLKADGVPFEERQDQLDAVEAPRPLAAELEAMFSTYAADNPWVWGAELRPKAVVLDMFLAGDTFTTYVQRLGVKRSEGLLLRYLGDVWRAFRRGLPTAVMTDEIDEFVAWLASVIRRVDSSLLDEWDRLDAIARGEPLPEIDDGPYDITRDPPAFRAAVRRTMFRAVEDLAAQRWDGLAGRFATRPDTDELAATLQPLWDDVDAVDIGPEARATHLISISPGRDTWEVTQHVVDADDHDTIAWIRAEVDVDASREVQDVVARIVEVELPPR